MGESSHHQHIDCRIESKSNGDPKHHISSRDTEVLAEHQYEEHQSALHHADAALHQVNSVCDVVYLVRVPRGNCPHPCHEKNYQCAPAKQNDAEIAQRLVWPEGVLKDLQKDGKGYD